ncbi:Ig-like domain repeat protein [Nocardioides ferulae]|uniref:Ig-like domain repeat protein n=1 Tax=Nocardioides ferulae TaxID=2340821 RepID=UPI000EAF9C23|nr:Ig-like domain repeat protein [Nocardioides ferulae]
MHMVQRALSAVAVVPKLKPGKHRLTAAFTGDTAIAGSTSKPVTLTIVKRGSAAEAAPDGEGNMNHLHTARRLTTGLAAGAVLSTALAAGTTGATAAEPERPPAAAPAADALFLDQLQLLVAPLLSGLGQVGQLLSVSQPEWSLPGVSTDIEWLCNGSPIAGTEGMWEYVPTEMQQGCAVAARVTGTLLGLLPLEYITNALPIPFIGQEDQTPQATAQPTVTGTAKVGQQLTGSDPTWDADGVENAYQWLRNGAPITGATTKTYLLTVEDAGKQVAFKVTGKKGSATGIATSSPVSVEPGDAPTATTPVRTTGKGRVGSLLEALDPAWSGSGTITTSFQWLRDGLAIPGATGRSYRVAAQDVGSDLAVRATGTRTGYAPGTSTSAPVTVQQSPTTTRAVLARKVVARGQRAVLKVIVSPRGGGAAPTGKVTVLEGGKKLKAMTMKASHEGRASVTLPRLKPGKHRLKVTYAGSTTLRGSKAKAVVLTVRR